MRKCRAGGAGTLSGQFSLRVLGQAFPTSPFLFFGSAKPFLLFRREREEMVSVVLRRRSGETPPHQSALRLTASPQGEAFGGCAAEAALCTETPRPCGRGVPVVCVYFRREKITLGGGAPLQVYNNRYLWRNLEARVNNL